MAYADYMHCAVCDAKVHYDAEVNYDYHPECIPLVLCEECIRTHEIVVKKRDKLLEVDVTKAKELAHR